LQEFSAFHRGLLMIFSCFTTGAGHDSSVPGDYFLNL
jgi:hypothetical protein